MLLAAGNGQRAGHATNKVFLPLAGRRVFTWSLDWTAAMSEITQSLLVVRDEDRDFATTTLARESPGRDVRVVVGGSTRHGSEWAALSALADEIRAGTIDVVVIHDAARPLAGSALFRDVIDTARRRGGALPGRPAPALLATMIDGSEEFVPLAPAVTNGHGPPRRHTVAVQTPQAFRAAPLLEAYEAAERSGFVGSDTAACIERFGSLDIAYLPGEAHNIKITFPEDLFVAERLLARSGFLLARPPRGHR